MRKFGIITLLVSLLLSCTKDEGEVLFEMVYPNFEVSIPPGLGTLSSHVLNISNIDTNIDFFLNNAGITAEQLNTISPARATLTSLDGFDFDIIDEISIRICDPQDINCNLEIFYLDNIPFNIGAELRMQPTLADVKQFLTLEQFRIELVIVQLRDITPILIESELDISFEAR